jgi:MoaA/NifB/PqqE/SkfB family radical SAM enzyme
MLGVDGSMGTAQRARVAASFDVTGECGLRCAHCYFFAGKAPPCDMDDEQFLRRAMEARDIYRIGTALWVGGEPLRRLGLLRRLVAQFRRNAVATSAMTPLPDDLGAGLLVSIDGPRESHDQLRGSGAFDVALGNLRPLPSASFVLSVTITGATQDAVDALPRVVEQTRALGVLVGFYTSPAKDNRFNLSDMQRDQVVDRLLTLREKVPGVVLNTEASLAMMRSHSAADMSARCIYRRGAVAFDAEVKRKRPCTFGSQANCARCGCALMALQAAASMGDRASVGVMAAVFPVG